MDFVRWFVIYVFIGIMLESAILHRLVLGLKTKIYERDIIIMLIFLPSTIICYMFWIISNFIINCIVFVCSVAYRLIKKILSFKNNTIWEKQDDSWTNVNKINKE